MGSSGRYCHLLLFFFSCTMWPVVIRLHKVQMWEIDDFFFFFFHYFIRNLWLQLILQEKKLLFSKVGYLSSPMNTGLLESWTPLEWSQLSTSSLSSHSHWHSVCGDKRVQTVPLFLYPFHVLITDSGELEVHWCIPRRGLVHRYMHTLLGQDCWVTSLINWKPTSCYYAGVL